MDDVGRVHVLKATEELVQKVSRVLWCKCLGRVYDLVQITLHEVQHHVPAHKGSEKVFL